MKLDSISSQASPNNPDLTFRFDDSVDQFLVGATNIYYTFGDKDHQVRQIKLNMDSSNSGQEVSTSVTMSLNDEGSHNISSSSFVDVSCLAATGSNSNSTAKLVSGLAFPSGSSSNPIGLANDTYSNEAILEGFELAYEGEDHHIKQMYGKLSSTVQQGESVIVSGSADMSDDSGNNANIKSLQSGYLGTYIDGNASGLVVVEKSYDTSDGPQTVDLGALLGTKSLTNAAVFIRSFDVSFSKDHHMKSLYLGASDVSITAQEVLFSPQISMKDDSDNKASGNIKLVIVGLCDPD